MRKRFLVIEAFDFFPMIFARSVFLRTRMIASLRISFYSVFLPRKCSKFLIRCSNFLYSDSGTKFSSFSIPLLSTPFPSKSIFFFAEQRRFPYNPFIHNSSIYALFPLLRSLLTFMILSGNFLELITKIMSDAQLE